MQFSCNNPQKRYIAKELGLPCGQEDSEFSIEPSIGAFKDLLIAARIHCLSNDEIYFLQCSSDLRNPLNHRNEAAALSLLLQRLKEQSAPCIDEAIRIDISKHCDDLWHAFSGSNQPESVGRALTDDTSSRFHAWAQERGIQHRIRLARFGDIRGCAAVEEIIPGQNILSIPRASLMYDETVRETDLGAMLYSLPGLAADNLLIIFTMIDRFDRDSKWYDFWQSLPERYYTGLTFPSHFLDMLEGTAACMEARRGQTHLRAQYEKTKPLFDALLAAYPMHLKAHWFTFENYAWAAELWYGYAFEIEFPPSQKSKTVMVPFACHVNHSPWPHVVRYGKLNVDTQTLDFPAFRRCAESQQVFISYGPVPNLKLITYYGFSIPNNPHDLVPLTLEAPDDIDDASLLERSLSLCELQKDHNLRDGPLSKHLIGYMRIIGASPRELEQYVLSGKVDPREEPLSRGSEVCAIDALAKCVRGVLESVSEAKHRIENAAEFDKASSETNENGLDPGWHASLQYLTVYVDGQISILKRSLLECEQMMDALCN